MAAVQCPSHKHFRRTEPTLCSSKSNRPFHKGNSSDASPSQPPATVLSSCHQQPRSAKTSPFTPTRKGQVPTAPPGHSSFGNKAPWADNNLHALLLQECRVGGEVWNLPPDSLSLPSAWIRFPAPEWQTCHRDRQAECGQGEKTTSWRAMQPLGSESLLKPGAVVQGWLFQNSELLHVNLKNIPSAHHWWSSG